MRPSSRIVALGSLMSPQRSIRKIEGAVKCQFRNLAQVFSCIAWTMLFIIHSVRDLNSSISSLRLHILLNLEVLGMIIFIIIRELSTGRLPATSLEMFFLILHLCNLKIIFNLPINN